MMQNGTGVLMATHGRRRSIWDPRSSAGRIGDSFRKLHPRTMARNPVMFVVEIGSVLTTVELLRARGHWRRRDRLRAPDHVLAVAHGAVRQLRRGDGRRAAARRRPTRCAARRRRRSPTASGPDGTYETVPAPSLRKGDVVRVAAGESDSRRRRHHRRRRVGGRERHHRRVGAGHSRVGRRPLGGHRRHARALRLDPRARHGESRRDVPRSDDRAGRRRRAAEDAERDRAQHPARGADDRLPDRRGHAAAVRDLLGRAAVGLRAGLAARLSHPDDDRRPAVGDRHRRHGSAGAAQRAGDVRARGRGRRRRAHAAARQDRDDHARQSSGDRVHPAARHQRGGARRRGAAGVAARRDAGRTLDRRAGQGEVRPARPRAVAPAGDVRAVHGADAHVGRQSARAAAGAGRRRSRPPRSGRRCPRDPQGRGRCDRTVGRVERRNDPARACRPSSQRIARAGGTPLVVAEGAPCARRHPPEGHRQGRHPRALRAPARDGHQDGDDHRRQPADGRGDRLRRRAWTTSSRRRRPRTRWR